MSENKQILKNAGILKEIKEYDVKIDIPEQVLKIHHAFKKHKQSLFIVGGYVRDFLLGQKGKDIDLSTPAMPQIVQNILNAENIKNFPKGIDFGVISAIIDNEEYEIATFRSDSKESDGRRPTSVHFTDMQGDSSRRDLSYNSLFYDIDKQKIIDFHNGVEHLKQKITRTVGNPMDRYQEDRLRISRTLRMAHRFGSTLDQDTLDAIIHFKDLPGVSAERITDEFKKAIKSAIKPEAFLTQYTELGLMPRTFPGIQINQNFVPGLRNLCMVVAKLVDSNSIDKITKSLREAAMSSHEIDTIQFLIKLGQRFSQFDKLVFDPTIDGKWFTLLLKERDQILTYGKISSDDLIQWAEINKISIHLMKIFIDFNFMYSAKDFHEIKPGPELGQAISKSNAEEFLKKL